MKVLCLIALFAFIVPAISLSLYSASPPPMCSAPQCIGRDRRASRCQCRNITASTCPPGYPPLDGKKCGCAAFTEPKCKSGDTMVREGDMCKCVREKEPRITCSSGYTLISSDAKCQRCIKPSCPRGYKLDGCNCVKSKNIRSCPANTKISNDRCSCTDFYFRQCKPPCVLSAPCKCIPGFHCFTNTKCSGPYTVVSDVSKCCGKAIPARDLVALSQSHGMMTESDNPFANLETFDQEAATYMEYPFLGVKRSVFESDMRKAFLEEEDDDDDDNEDSGDDGDEEDDDQEDEAEEEEEEDDKTIHYGKSYSKDGKCYICSGWKG